MKKPLATVVAQWRDLRVKDVTPVQVIKKSEVVPFWSPREYDPYPDADWHDDVVWIHYAEELSLTGKIITDKKPLVVGDLFTLEKRTFAISEVMHSRKKKRFLNQIVARSFAPATNRKL
jgi:hypothetical protein